MFKIPLAIFGIDRLIKFHVDKKLKLNESREICSGRVILRKYYNKGAAFGILASAPKLLAAVQGALLTACAIGYCLLWKKEGRRGLKLSMGMLLGGGLGNFYDRLKYKHIVDYVSFSVPWKWLRRLVFNLADFFIFAGMFFIAVFGSPDDF